MKNLIAVSAAVACALVAASASAEGNNENARIVVKGRQIVWVQPQDVKPFALTGDQRANADVSKRPALEPRGRAGYARR